MIAKFGFDSEPLFAEEPVPSGYELVEGELVEMPTKSEESSWIGGQLFAAINKYCMTHDLGRVYPQDTPFRGFPGEQITVRKPDAAFVHKDRLSARPSRRDLAIAPDLAVEVLSPNDVAVDVNQKVEQYLSAGVRLVWVVDPMCRLVYVHRPSGAFAVAREPAELDGEEVLPGFRCPITSFLPPPEPQDSSSDH